MRAQCIWKFSWSARIQELKQGEVDTLDKAFPKAAISMGRNLDRERA
jgi:hypothetical protein